MVNLRVFEQEYNAFSPLFVSSAGKKNTLQRGQSMKRKAFVTVLLVMAGALVFTGCDNGSTSGSGINFNVKKGRLTVTDIPAGLHNGYFVILGDNTANADKEFNIANINGFVPVPLEAYCIIELWLDDGNRLIDFEDETYDIRILWNPTVPNEDTVFSLLETYKDITFTNGAATVSLSGVSIP
jgi:hypothetical protein